MKTVYIFLCLFLAASLPGCGFRPVYSTLPGDERPLYGAVMLASVSAPESVRHIVNAGLERRFPYVDGKIPAYVLDVSVGESADELAVQIDATVTRFNYRLDADYVLVHKRTGRRSTGRTAASASFNVVPSEYSTLYAQRRAKEKAARMLVERLERHLLPELLRDAGKNAPSSGPDA